MLHCDVQAVKSPGVPKRFMFKRQGNKGHIAAIDPLSKDMREAATASETDRGEAGSDEHSPARPPELGHF